MGRSRIYPFFFSLDKMKQLLFCSIACVLLKARLCLTAGVVRSLRYVMEVIQRGRTAVRPALFPPLSVVPAVSDSELSEPEYVHYVLPVLLPVTLPIMSKLPIVHGKPTSLPFPFFVEPLTLGYLAIDNSNFCSILTPLWGAPQWNLMCIRISIISSIH